VQFHFGFPAAPIGPASVTIGSYDGVHLGHQRIIGRILEAARETNSNSVLVTFEPHPRCVLDPANCPGSITTLKEKLELVEDLGVGHTVVLEFTRQLSELSPAEFLKGLNADIRRVVCGPDFAFGHKRAGTVDWLRSNGYEVEVVSTLKVEGEEVRSSEIRHHVTAGDIERANLLLGRPFAIAGLVEHGEQVGRTLGFPTVNVAVEPHKLVPANGVYAGWALAAGAEHMCALSVGYRPTFGGRQLRVEGHLLDFDGDLYQQWVELRFVCRIRDSQIKFDSADELSAQIANDVEATRRALRN
jgi:riboflavin kinase / FMN adenylyltransferase